MSATFNLTTAAPIYSTADRSPDAVQTWLSVHKGAITSKIKHAIKIKTSPARLA